MPRIHLIANLGAILVIARFKSDGRMVILADKDEPWRTVAAVARPLLRREERRALLSALLA